MSRALLLGALCAGATLPAVASAQTPVVVYHAYVTEPDGTAKSGSFSVTFSLHDAPEAGNEIWSESQTVNLDAGNLTARLGATTPLSPTMFEGKAVFLGVRFGTEDLPRQPVGWVPQALRVQDSAGLAGRPVVSTGCAAGQVLTFTDSGWTCGASGPSYSPGAGLQISGTVISLPQGCAQNEVLKWDGSTWGCAADAESVLTPGSGLQQSGGAFSLITTCGVGQILKWDGAQWGCTPDDSTPLAAGSGLSLTNNTFSLVASCGANQILKWDGSGWGCAPDAATVYGVVDGGGLSLSGSSLRVVACGGSQVLKYNTATGSWGCAADVVGDPQTTYSAGAGLDLASTTFSIMPCMAKEHLRWNGTTWACAVDWAGDPIAPTHGGFGLDLSTAPAGTLIYANAAGQFGTLAPGGENQVLRIVGGIPQWSSGAEGTVTSITAGAGLTGGTILDGGTIAADEGYLATLGTPQTFTGAKTFANGTLKLRNSTNNASTTLVAPNATANRSITLPNATGLIPVAAAAPLAIADGGVLTIAAASTTGSGVMQAGNGLAASSGVVSVNIGTGSGTAAAGNDSRLAPAPVAAGRILYDNGSAWTALPAGSSGTLLRSGGSSAPAWQGLQQSDLPAHNIAAADIDGGVLGVSRGGTGASSIGAAGGICYSNGTGYVFTAAGSAGEVLRVVGANPPAWGGLALSDLGGTLPVSRGGTGATGSLNSGGVIYAADATSLASTSSGSSGQVLQHTGATPGWAAANAHDHVDQSWTRSSSGSVLSLSTSFGTGRALQAVASSSSGANFAVHAQTNSNTGRALYGLVNHSLASGARGVLGETNATATGAAAVEGRVTGTSGTTNGVHGNSLSSSGSGVFGEATASTGSAYGVAGETASASGVGVFGWATASSGSPSGVWGTATAPGAYGIMGVADGGTGAWGTTAEPTGRAVSAENSATTGVAYGLYAETASSTGRAIYGEAQASTGVNYGVYGETNSGTGYGLYTPQRAHVGQTLGVDGGLTVGASVSVNAGTGAASATSFSGNGAAITNMSASNVSGTLGFAAGGTGANLGGPIAGVLKKAPGATSLNLGGASASDITSGVLPIARGGTVSNIIGVNGAIIHSNGGFNTFTNVGTQGEFLRSNGSSAPTWSKVDLGTAAQVLGFVPPASGGLGLNTSSTPVGRTLVATGTGGWSVLSPGSSNGDVLTTTASGIAFQPVTLADNSIGFNKWAPNGCATGQRPIRNSAGWSCGITGNHVPSSNIITSITTGLNVYGQVAVAANGMPVIVRTGGVHVISCDDPACSSRTSQVVENSGFVEDPAIAIGADGNPIIAYLNRTDGEMRTAKCNDPACTSAVITNHATVSSTRSYTSIAIATDGRAIISWYDGGATNLTVLKCGNTACDSGNVTSNPDAAGSAGGGNEDIGQFSSIAIGADGRAIISYFNASAIALKVAKCSNSSCSTAAITTVDNGAGAGQHTSISIGNDGLPIISYSQSNVGLRVAKCGNVSCSSGNTLTTVDSTTQVQFTSLTFGPDGLPVIAYHISGANELKVARCGDPTCSANASKVIVDTSGDTGNFASATVGADGLPVILYLDQTTFTLRLARCSSLTCIPFWSTR